MGRTCRYGLRGFHGIYLEILIRPLGGIWNIYELLPAFLIACAAIVIVSLLTPKPSKEIEEEFDRVAQMK